MKKTLPSLANTLFIVIFMGVSLLCSGFGQTAKAQGDSIYSVEGVVVDETAENAVEARNKAISQGQYKAFTQLAEKLLVTEGRTEIPAPQTFQLQSMVKSFELYDEKTSSKRYIAKMNVHFKPKAVKQFLGTTGSNFSTTKSQPVLVLPFFQAGTDTILWEGANPWRDAWDRSTPESSLVPIKIPVGDAQDIVDMPDASIMGASPAILQNIMARYGVGSIIIATLMPEQTARVGDVPKRGRIFLLHFGEGYDNQTHTINLEFNPVTDEGTVVGADAFYDFAVTRMVNYITHEWKGRTSATGKVERKIAAEFVFSHLREWVQLSRELQKLEIVKEVNVDRLAPQKAELTLVFNGDIDTLRLTLAQKNIDLAEPSIDAATLAEGQGHGDVLRYKISVQ